MSKQIPCGRFRVGLGFGPQLIGEILSLCQDFSRLPRDLDPSRLDYFPRSMVEHPYMILPSLVAPQAGVGVIPCTDRDFGTSNCQRHLVTAQIDPANRYRLL